MVIQTGQNVGFLHPRVGINAPFCTDFHRADIKVVVRNVPRASRRQEGLF